LTSTSTQKSPTPNEQTPVLSPAIKPSLLTFTQLVAQHVHLSNPCAATMRASRVFLRSTRASARPSTPALSHRPITVPALHSRLIVASTTQLSAARQFSTTPTTFKGLAPDSSDPEPPKTEPHANTGSAAQISDAEYHEIADQYLDNLVLKLEELGEKASEGLEAEFSVCILPAFPSYPIQLSTNRCLRLVS